MTLCFVDIPRRPFDDPAAPSSTRVSFALEPSKLEAGGVRTPLGFAAPYLDPDHPLLRSAVLGEDLEQARVPASDDFWQGGCSAMMAHCPMGGCHLHSRVTRR